VKAITLYQPWASLIAEGVKTIETRPKRSPWSSAIGETIAIHAAKRRPEWGDMKRVVADNLDAWNAWHAAGYVDSGGGVGTAPLGAIVATCTLRKVLPIVDLGYALTVGENVEAITENEGDDDSLSHWVPGKSSEICIPEQRPFGDYAPGRFALLLDHARKCVPFPCRGFQGLWTISEGIAENLVS
jgi:hypothetical protein